MTSRSDDKGEDPTEDEEHRVARKRPRDGDDDAVVEKCGDRAEWGEEMHKMFVAAIYEVGLRNSSPAVILENMTQKPKAITSERIKSKLQKYRNNRVKSKQEFMEDYSSFLHRAHAIECAGGAGGTVAPPVALLEMMGSSKLLGGDAAAFLSYAVMKEGEDNQEGGTEGSALSTRFLRKGAMDYIENFAGASIPFPELSEEEKKTSLGVSMTFVMGLFLSMTQHLMMERASTEKMTNTESNLNLKLKASPSQSSATEAATIICDQTANSGQSDSKRSSKVSFSVDKAGQYHSFESTQNSNGVPSSARDCEASGEEARDIQSP